MTQSWENLIEALREELREYGGLRNILDEQQKAIFSRDAGVVAQLNFSLNGQIEATARLRQAREILMRKIALQNSLPEDTTLAKLKGVFPPVAQPLFKAISDEINAMISVLRRRSRQNQMLLARTCETLEQTLRALRPDSFTKTYSARGSIAVHVGPLGGHIQAAG